MWNTPTSPSFSLFHHLQAQLKALYPQLVFKSVRGNLNTRLSKLENSTEDGGEGHRFSALVLAAAGVIRLGWSAKIGELLDLTRKRGPDAVTRSADFVVLCEDLLSGRGEASGVALARQDQLCVAGPALQAQNSCSIDWSAPGVRGAASRRPGGAATATADGAWKDLKTILAVTTVLFSCKAASGTLTTCTVAVQTATDGSGTSATTVSVLLDGTVRENIARFLPDADPAGVVAAARAAGGEVIGVIPQLLVEAEVAHQGLTALEVVGTMHERKARFTELADGFITLPGGIGTLEELFETWTGGFLGEHDKPVVLLDADGFYQPMLRWLDTLHAEGFVAPAALERLLVAGSVADAVTLVTRQ